MYFVGRMFTIPIFGPYVVCFSVICPVWAFWSIAHLLSLSSCRHQLGPAFNPAAGRTFFEWFWMDTIKMNTGQHFQLCMHKVVV